MSNTRSTTDYSQFSFLVDNRQTATAHINKLKNAIRNNPEILEVQPILVNEKMQIIDGQHRFQAASELGLPIHYNMVKGLDIHTAREMNVLQRKWGIDDYATSYSKAGNENYLRFNEARHKHPSLSASTIMLVLGGDNGSKETHDFRSGKFVVTRNEEDADWMLVQLEMIREITNGMPLSKSFVSAFVQAIDNEDFSYEIFLNNLKKKPEMFHRTGTVRDSLRMVEDIHNHNKSVNLIRLY